MSFTPLNKIPNFGVNFGKDTTIMSRLERAGLKNCLDMHKCSIEELSQHLDPKSVAWVYEVSRGIDNSPVLPKGILFLLDCSKID